MIEKNYKFRIRNGMKRNIKGLITILIYISIHLLIFYFIYNFTKLNINIISYFIITSLILTIYSEYNYYKIKIIFIELNLDNILTIEYYFLTKIKN